MIKDTFHIEFESEQGLSEKAKQLIRAALGLALSQVHYKYSLKWASERKYWNEDNA